MCYSLEASLTALTTGLLGGGALTLNHNPSEKILGYLFMYVSLMQGFDAVFWTTDKKVKSGDKTAIEINESLTKIAMIVNHLQPVVLGWLIYLFKGNVEMGSLVVLFIYVLTAIQWEIGVWPKLSTTIEKPPASPGLFWEWTATIDYRGWLFYGFFALTISTLILQNLDFPANALGIGLILTTLGFSLQQYTPKSDVGRWWCNYAAYIPLCYQVFQKTSFKL
jgi:hypothetical protein